MAEGAFLCRHEVALNPDTENAKSNTSPNINGTDERQDEKLFKKFIALRIIIQTGKCHTTGS